MPNVVRETPRAREPGTIRELQAKLAVVQAEIELERRKHELLVVFEAELRKITDRIEALQ